MWYKLFLSQRETKVPEGNPCDKLWMVMTMKREVDTLDWKLRDCPPSLFFCDASCSWLSSGELHLLKIAYLPFSDATATPPRAEVGASVCFAAPALCGSLYSRESSVGTLFSSPAAFYLTFYPVFVYFGETHEKCEILFHNWSSLGYRGELIEKWHLYTAASCIFDLIMSIFRKYNLNDVSLWSLLIKLTKAFIDIRAI